MSLSERGAYVTLLGYCWMEGSIPDDAVKLARLCRCGQGEMKRVWPAIRRRFSIDVSEGRLTNPRIEQERSALSAKSEVGRYAAKARWERGEHAPKTEPISHAFGYASALQTHMPNGCERNANAMRTHQETDANCMPTQCERIENASGTSRIPRASPPAPGAPAPREPARRICARDEISPAMRTQCERNASQSHLQSQSTTSSSSEGSATTKLEEAATDPEEQAAAWLHEAIVALSPGSRMPPDREISRRVLSAAGGDLEGLGDYLGGLVSAGRRIEIREYAWFETAAKNHFARKNGST